MCVKWRKMEGTGVKTKRERYFYIFTLEKLAKIGVLIK